MAVLYGYFDESGKAHQHKVVVFSGFVTTYDWWESLGDEWKRLLRQYNLPALHFKSEKKRTSMLKKFIDVIRTQVEYGVTVAVKVDAFDALPVALKKEIGGDAHYLAFKSVVFAIVNRMAMEPGSTINFTCDEDEATTLKCYKWYKQIKSQEATMRSKLVSFCVADDEHFPQLQAADVFAALTRAEAERQLLGVTSEMQTLFEHLNRQDEHGRLTFHGLFVDERNLQGLVEAFAEELVKLISCPDPEG
jgi:hypothetical protein